LIIEFDKPIILGLINIWNYIKTFQRGVKAIEIFIDNNMVYNGNLNPPNKE